MTKPMTRRSRREFIARASQHLKSMRAALVHEVPLILSLVPLIARSSSLVTHCSASDQVYQIRLRCSFGYDKGVGGAPENRLQGCQDCFCMGKCVWCPGAAAWRLVLGRETQIILNRAHARDRVRHHCGLQAPRPG
jgi:hypothetical protein